MLDRALSSYLKADKETERHMALVELAAGDPSHDLRSAEEVKRSERAVRAAEHAIASAQQRFGELLEAWYAAEDTFVVAAEGDLDAFEREASALRTTGNAAVSITRFASAESPEDEVAMAMLVVKLGMQPDRAAEIVKRVQHLGPQEVAAAITLDEAIHVKEALERVGMHARITEATARAPGERRQSIPEQVRHEVWRRDEGQCVDCGSRERLEFDHIIPVSRGGSNTARNIELRCEACNRRKAASV